MPVHRRARPIPRRGAPQRVREPPAGPRDLEGTLPAAALDFLDTRGVGAERSAEHRRAADARLRSLLPLLTRLRLSPDRSCALELPAAHAVEDQLRDGRRSTGAGHHRQPTVLGEPVQPEVLADPIVIHPIPSRSALARRADDAIGSRAAAGRAARVRRNAAAVRRVAGARCCCGRGGHARVAALRQEADWPHRSDRSVVRSRPRPRHT